MISLKSKITRKLLKYFFLHEEERMYLNRMCERLGLDKRNLKKKLKELAGEGLFRREKEANRTYYRLNNDYPLYEEYKNIVLKSAGRENPPAVNIAKSFKEAREWDRKYEESLSPRQRHEASMYLKEIYRRRSGMDTREVQAVVSIRKVERAGT